MNLKCCVFTAAACVSAAVFASESNIVLCERGKVANASIVLPEKAGPSVRYAAEELQRCIGKMTDVKLPIVKSILRTRWKMNWLMRLSVCLIMRG